MEKMLSVIIPIFNAEKYLEQCLNSILTQPIKNMEVICINDGSTDDSLKILENMGGYIQWESCKMRKNI